MKVADVVIINKVKKLRPGAVALLAIGVLKVLKENYGVSQKDIKILIDKAKEEEEKLRNR